ncbi:MAG: HAD family phosphatase [Chloroflexi bacterium]|nr:HAD family phosphatase [Chloroflexota bacterium]
MQVVLWDLDGTLADTEAVHFAAWQATMRALQIAYSYAKFMESFGRNNREILPTLLGPHATQDQIEAASEQKEGLYRELLRQQGLQLLPGVADWLAHFQAAGLRQVISSSGPMANIVASVEALRIGDFFASLMSGARLPEGKPHPAIFLNSAAAVGVIPATCVVIEDSLAGIVAARRAGMASIAVGKVIETPAFHQMLATQTGPTCLPIASLEQLQWHQIAALSG